MRNTTKLKHLLLKYRLEIDLNTDDQFSILLIPKNNNDHAISIVADNYSSAIDKAFRSMMRSLKTEEKQINAK